MSKIFLLAISLCVSMALPGQSAVPADAGNLPVFFKDNLIYLVVPLPGRDSLVFYTDTGGRTFLYPHTLSLLFDTGAQVALSTAALVALDASPLVATSFISSDLFDKWKRIHLEWEIIEKADRQYKEDMIRVPEIGVGNQTIGPVWFVKRDEQNFRVMSEIFMDKPIVGALGGNALSLLANIVVDYRTGWLYVFTPVLSP